jgi:hypothetical protein
MIISRLTDGLGNQMFQYAAGRRLAHHLGTDLILDVSLYANQSPTSTPRRYELDFFRIQATIAQAGLVHIWRNPPFTTLMDSELYRPEVLNAHDNTYLIGYWQCERYFEDIRTLIFGEFMPAQSPDEANINTSRKIERSVSISIHVRRGDYVSNKFHSFLGLDYYRIAVTEITKKIQRPDFFVFSDDPEWCRQNLDIVFPYTLVTHNSGPRAYWDITLMSRCQHNIIANSSFSWWGAWLNRNPGKIVIAPKQWFGDPTVDTSDRVPDDWIRL